MEGSVTGPVFLQAAQDLLNKVEGDRDPKAIALAADASRLVARFRRWVTARPEPDERADAVNQLVELNRKVLIYVSKKTRG
jgi:hypothetical protein